MSRRSFLAWSWTMVILALCWTPRVLLPVRESGPRPLVIPHLDKAVHFGIFAVFAFLWMRVGTRPDRTGRVAAAGLLLALVSELGQLMPFVGRDASLADGLADSIGVALGIVAYRLSQRRVGDRPA